MSYADTIRARFAEALRDLDWQLQKEAERVGRRMLRWLADRWPRMPCDSWRGEFEKIVADLAGEEVFVEEQSRRDFIAWLGEVNASAAVARAEGLDRAPAPSSKAPRARSCSISSAPSPSCSKRFRPTASTRRSPASKASSSVFGDAPRCENCGRYVGMRKWLPPYRVELEAWGNEFADIVSTGTDLLVSLPFKQAWGQSSLVGLSGFEAVEVVKITCHRKPIKDQPAYFRAAVHRSRTKINLAASEFEWQTPPTCPVCCLGDVVERWKRIVIDESTWSGEDVFIARGLPGTIIASERFREFCERNHMKNVAFVPAEDYGHDYYPCEP
ncbi:MAG TPA: hypothetical protein VHV55_27130 [Pirellulales bacterium]|jgi:hypothetical protein|nr:hypothetical protein [Pirellulales bacterium]